jgi:hypothetical protein
MTPPRLGQGGRSALKSCGLSAYEIDKLEASGAVVFNDD